MDYGFNMPTRGPLANAESLRAMAARGEALGFGYFAVPDHIVVPRAIDSRYPYSETGAFPGSDTGECLEQLTVMSYLAAITTKARLLTSVMVVPHRRPVNTAKILASIDVLSGGRVTVACGVGWMAEEFEAIGAAPFAERGKVTDEYIAVFRELWTNDDPSFDGDYAKFANISFLPKPVQPAGPPIWIGGESGPAIRRAARLGDCWYPIGTNPRYPMNTAARFQAGVDQLRQFAEEGGRDPNAVDLAFWANWYVEDQTRPPQDGDRHLFTGNAGEIVEDIGRLREIGVKHLLFNFQRQTLAATLAAMERFASDVLSRVGD